MPADQLPVTLKLAVGEALDGYLERVADANYLTTAMLLHLVRGADTDRFLILKPNGTVATRLAALTGLAEADIDAATLGGMEGTVLDLSGFEARDRHTYRRIAARGWADIHGSQVCPQCIASGGIWRLCWRTPYSAICVQHKTYLFDSPRVSWSLIERKDDESWQHQGSTRKS